jgi:hypothetical protein
MAKSAEKADIVSRLTNNQTEVDALKREMNNILRQESADVNR